jgi:phage terminase large subunit-like protein
MAAELADEGLPMVEVGATVKNFSQPMKEQQGWVRSKSYHHDGDPVMTWMMSNVVAKMDRKENVFPNKEFPANKIDGPVAEFMAVNRLLLQEGEPLAPSFSYV